MSIPFMVSMIEPTTLAAWRMSASAVSTLTTTTNLPYAYDTTATAVDASTYAYASRTRTTSGSISGTLTYSGMPGGIATGTLYARLTTSTAYKTDGDYEAISSVSLKYKLTDAASYTTKQTWSGGLDADSLVVAIAENVTVNLSRISVQYYLTARRTPTGLYAYAHLNAYDIVFVGVLENRARPRSCDNAAQWTDWYDACDTTGPTVDSTTSAISPIIASGKMSTVIFSNFDSRTNMHGYLKMRLSTALTQAGEFEGACNVYYSTDGGSNWISWASYYYGNDASSSNVLSVELSSLNMANLQVKVEFLAPGGVSIYDIVFLMT